MKDSDWIKTFDHLENGVWQAAELVKTDSVANTRTVKYKNFQMKNSRKRKLKHM